MDATAQDANVYFGIDVSKDQLDVHIHPAGEAFSVSRNQAGLEELIERLKAHALKAVAVEASGGFEAIAIASLVAVGLPVIRVNPAQVRALPLANAPRPTLSMRPSSRASPKQPNPRSGLCQVKKRWLWLISWQGAGRSCR